MIRFALSCDKGHGFEAWFSSGGAYEEQIEARAVACPACGSAKVSKAPMAPAVLRGRGRATPETPAASEGKRAFAVVGNLYAHLKANAENVGAAFPEEARKMYYGEAETRSIYGEASSEEAKALHDEGIEVVPLPRLPEDQN
ncbi:MAG: DUF1178 family protein [Methyloceanibacter sp.]